MLRICEPPNDTSVLQINDRAMTGNLDSKIVSIDSYLKVEMAGKCSTFMYLFLCTTSMTIGSLSGMSTKIEVWGQKAMIPTIFREFLLSQLREVGVQVSEVKNIEN
jgi:hypothetical protein